MICHGNIAWRVRLVVVMSAIILHSSLFILHSSAREVEVNDSVTLSQIVVTGTRTPKSLAETPIPTRVITQDDIQRADATDVQELLQQEMPGVEFSFAMNQQTHLNFSGFGGQSILFLVDGERLAGETMDDVDFSRIVMCGVGHIEIVKSAASALYGSNAGGGVVNVITTLPQGRGTSLHLDSRWSRHGGQRYNLLLGLNRKRWNNLFTASFSNVNTYSVKNGENPAALTFSEVYGSKVVNVKDRLTVHLLENLHLTDRLGYYFRQTARVVTAPDRYRDFSAGLKAVWDIGRNDNLDIAYAFDQYDKSAKQQAMNLDLRIYSNVQNSVRMLYSHTTGRGDIMTVGGDFMRDYLYNTRLATPKHHQNSADAFAQFDWTIDPRWEMVGALRYDYFSDGDLSRLTPKFSVRYTPPLGETEGVLSLRAGYGMGFRAPTLKEKYYEFDMAGKWIILGNPNLKAEMSHNVNLSAEYSRGRYDFMVMGYYNNVRNKIATGKPYSLQSQLYLPYINFDRYSAYGAELSARCSYTLGAGWGGVAKLGYAYVKENDNGDGEDVVSQYIPARPHSMTWEGSVDKSFHKNYGLGITLSGRFLSAVDNNGVHYPAYMLWKLLVSQRVWQKVRMTLTFENLFGYTPEYYYLNAPVTDGTDVMFGLSYDL